MHGINVATLSIQCLIINSCLSNSFENTDTLPLPLSMQYKHYHWDMISYYLTVYYITDHYMDINICHMSHYDTDTYISNTSAENPVYRASYCSQYSVCSLHWHCINYHVVCILSAACIGIA